MFYYIEGTVTVLDAGLAVIDAGGVGYCCYTTTYTLAKLEKGKKARLYTYCNIKEDAFDIYGFYDVSEKKCFEMLLSVSGVGPKAAQAILSTVTPDGLAMAILSGDDKALTSAPGVGKRIAQRIIMELKDKMEKAASGMSVTPGSAPMPAAGGAKKVADAAAALTALGYSANEIAAAMKTIDTELLSTEEIIRYVLAGSVK